ncbi:uncharacterized protein BX664DRAFT_344168 [Halteromyces radiatus]|uniref:uncharacterized protein n=1 Tax=Halteromyces radiatus TaxID=101107 RepID=UPI0022210F91|nr:uncharacterized protein BX664DRAFT_344168 [Halteromyces radiatus]KAI8076884.1 hypothetical protein BX664DRAFT_344168 [Halteromyces radiatus]
MSYTGPAGFYNAPVTKLLVVSIGVLSILGSILKLKPYYQLQLFPHITIHHQFWRLITCQIPFTSSGDVFFGTMIIYSMRIIERQFGTSKYVAFVFVTICLATLLEIGALVTGIKLGFRYVPGGPYALLFAMLYQYHRMVPGLYRFRIFNITFNNKIFLYMLCFQIFISQGVNTIVPCVCGLLAGAFYRSDVGGIKQWRFSDRLQSFSSRYLQPLLATPPVPRSNNALPIRRPIIAIGMEGLVATATGIGINNNDNNRRRRSADNTMSATSTSMGDDDDDALSINTDTSIASNEIRRNTGNRVAGPSTSMRDYLDALTGRTPLTSSEIEPPLPEHLIVLSSMFPDHPRETITNALSAAHNNINRAVEIMLHTPAPSSSISISSSSHP